MHIRPKRKGSDKIAVDMTPMIDIVFQLLTFFCMTLRVAAAEGDFNIRMPAVGPGSPSGELPPIHIYLQADAAGACSRVVLNEREFTGPERWERVHAQLAGIVGEGNLASQAEVELHCDSNLHYEHAIAAVTAVSGRLDPENGQVIKLIEKIKFSPPRTLD